MEFNFDISDFKAWLLSKIPFNPLQKKNLYYRTYLPANFSKRWRTNMNDPISMWRSERTGEVDAFVSNVSHSREWIRYFIESVGKKADPYCSYHWIEIYDAIRIVEQWQKFMHSDGKFEVVRRPRATKEVQKFFVSVPDRKDARDNFNLVLFANMFNEVIEHITDRSPYYFCPAESEGFDELKSALLDKLPYRKNDFAVHLARKDHWQRSPFPLTLPIPSEVFKRTEANPLYTPPEEISLALYHWVAEDSTINFAIIYK